MGKRRHPNVRREPDAPRGQEVLRSVMPRKAGSSRKRRGTLDVRRQPDGAPDPGPHCHPNRPPTPGSLKPPRCRVNPGGINPANLPERSSPRCHDHPDCRRKPRLRWTLKQGPSPLPPSVQGPPDADTGDAARSLPVRPSPPNDRPGLRARLLEDRNPTPPLRPNAVGECNLLLHLQQKVALAIG